MAGLQTCPSGLSGVICWVEALESGPVVGGGELPVARGSIPGEVTDAPRPRDDLGSSPRVLAPGRPRPQEQRANRRTEELAPGDGEHQPVTAYPREDARET